MFNTNYDEVGSLNKNLVLNTLGKVKIRYGKKFIDLLDSNGNLNIPKIIQVRNSVDDISSNGIYVVDNSIYIYYGGQLFSLVSENSNNNYIEYKSEQDLSSDQVQQAQKNIGLVYDSPENIKITNGIFFSGNKIYTVDSGNIKEYGSDVISELINRINSLEELCDDLDDSISELEAKSTS